MLYFGHRGAPGIPRNKENTIYSFKKAIAEGANALEFDVRKSKDGRIVVTHDKFNEEFNGQVPLLEEVLDTFGDGKIFLNIELKERLGAEVADMVMRRSLMDCVIVSAFDSDESKNEISWLDLLGLSKKIYVAPIASKKKIKKIGEEGLVKAALNIGAYAIHLQWTATTPSLVLLAHYHNLYVNVWIVNTLGGIRKMKEMEVNGIMSDIPELFSLC